ncbi:propionyl-CoA carboxylase alpha chain [Herbihabitans rhizosphaerae]|uniref:Propionyl-CoA carboxylase alpha chain n=1 Tax=Herbihabitans rhizosphaerae TaxID=1872711 RepID=A0A4Q7L5D9_9PSEU|nr:biotin carboxylase N-terminal domain-containing protein [Herbihabitans rhizosphaerae]RZS44859.1 propionyl-CoA carboxylase alpha chain [Herbihabitans rhizosphaerae]
MAITSVLVANRGEIARRVISTCRRLGIGTVAVFSDADADAPHVREADAAVRLPGVSPAETYLRPELLIKAAAGAGADAIHPGYGFLSENAGFAEQVAGAGLTWIGPPAKAIATMGSKIESKRLMADAGVPVLAELDPDEITEDQLPVLVKASAGGGGRGMRVVRELDELGAALISARAEAASAFGEETVFCERFLATGRHIEVQVMADAHGAVWAVGERECSIQRRHQKVVEEAPSPLVERVDGMRERLFDAAVRAASAVGYQGAGTVEFLADERGEFFFLEMNTRLQVEHPVTELTTGTDLVALQIAVAEGAPLPAERPESRGHAIEVRLYAEDPAQEWQPQSGTLHTVELANTVQFGLSTQDSGIRLDSGVDNGSVVSVHYDPMLAKVIAWAPERTAAARSLAGALAAAKIHGVVTNRDLLVRVLRHPAFLAGDTDTAFFDRHGLDTLSEPLADAETESLAALAAALADAERNRAAARVNGRLPSGWRNVVSQPQVKVYDSASGTHEVRYLLGRSGVTVEGRDGVRLVESTMDSVALEAGGVLRRFEVRRYGALVCVDSPLGPVALTAVERFTDPSAVLAEGSLVAPMPGTVIRVAVAEGDEVTENQPLLWLEAMKMEHAVRAPADGVVAELGVSAGAQVELGAVLAVVTPTS